ncbi:2-nitropropane dioxygenase, NPD [Metarhizium album ARSEF 1941]|uniref:2-nitropropane dioxygenase, NPD n=1 Tax=Metarhizium album (strain ARSEF 1941) TaxID=1081103 RepID=A0A0B2WSD3_METAS|nr:2-nitropropane dioxygenase, NPD [Metarhizium album ARSEF 1941]KHN96938.1 2-nitropropane dioxygenase, NPD [Metarhizium album ARSEF 1941]
MSPNKLQEWFPWVQTPVVCSAPMMGVATVELATQQLAALAANLTTSRALLGTSDGGRADVGVGFLTGHASVASFAETAVPVVAEHRPAAVWLFAPNQHVKPHGNIIRALKALDPAPRVFVQVGNVAAAREAVRDGADAIVCQGIDAGGHQFRRGAGVVTIVPEAREMLERAPRGSEVCVLAAGGIVDGRGLAAAMALGAYGVVMGTRFTVARESAYPDFRKHLVLSAVDGGISTLKSPFNDEINNSALYEALWGAHYDGRSVVSTIHEQFLAGSTLEDLRKSLAEDYSKDDAAKLINTWAGTGVGLVKEVLPAGEIVQEARETAKRTIRELVGQLCE